MTECLGCLYIETAPVVLEDGRTVCATCPDAKLELENLKEENKGIDI